MRLIPVAGTCTVKVPRFGPDAPCSASDLALQFSTPPPPPPPPAPPLPAEPLGEDPPLGASGRFAAGTSTMTALEARGRGAWPGAVPVTVATLMYVPALVIR